MFVDSERLRVRGEPRAATEGRSAQPLQNALPGQSPLSEQPFVSHLQRLQEAQLASPSGGSERVQQG